MVHLKDFYFDLMMIKHFKVKKTFRGSAMPTELFPLDMQIQTNLLLKLPKNGENVDLMRCFIQNQM